MNTMIPFEGICMNASGCRCTTFRDLVAIDASNSAATVTKSCTIEPRFGNPKPRYHAFDGGSINSNGLCNLGIKKYIDYAHMRTSSKPYIISIAGDRKAVKEMLVNNYGKVINKAYFEVNLVCPNVKSSSNFPKDLTKLLEECQYHNFKIGIKMPVVFDFGQIEIISNILNNFSLCIHYIVCSNSLPNGLVLKRIDNKIENAIIGGKEGVGGIGGKYLKPFSLMNVREFSERIIVPVIGCGGIESISDVEEYLHCGASWCQVGTHFKEYGVTVFDDLNKTEPL